MKVMATFADHWHNTNSVILDW